MSFNTWLPGDRTYDYNDGAVMALEYAQSPTGSLMVAKFTIPNAQAGIGVTFDMVDPVFDITKPPKVAYASTSEFTVSLKDADGWLWSATCPVQPLVKERGWDWSQFFIATVQDADKTGVTPPELPAAGRIIAFQFQGGEGVHGADNTLPQSISLAYIAGRSPDVAKSGTIRKVSMLDRNPRAHTWKVGEVRLDNGERRAISYFGTLPFGLMVGGPSRSRLAAIPYRGPYIAGYQSGTPWVDLSEPTKLGAMLDFMLESQAQFRSRSPTNVFGPFMHSYLPATWDSEQSGPIDTWVWDAPDGNPAWNGWQYRAFDAMAQTWMMVSGDGFMQGVTVKAQTVCLRFLEWIYGWLLDNPGANYIPSAWGPPGWTQGVPLPADSYLDPHGTAVEAHDLALVLKGAIYCAKAGANANMCALIIGRCIQALGFAQVQKKEDPMRGCFTLKPREFEAYGFQQGEILDALALAAQNEKLIPEPGSIIVEPRPTVTFSVTDLEFGPVLIGSSAIRNIVVKNEGVGGLLISSAVSSSPLFEVLSGWQSVITQGNTGTIRVRYTPTLAEPATATVTLSSNARGGPHSFGAVGLGRTNTNPDGMSYLTADGGKLRDNKGTGNIFTLKSINWYGLEQIGIPTGAWTRPFRTKLVDGVLREGMLDEIKRLGFNSIRLLFSQDCTWPGYAPKTSSGSWNSTYINPSMNGEFLNNFTDDNPQAVKPTIEIIDQFVSWCEELGLRVIFDMHTLAPDDSNVLATNGKWYTTATPDATGATAGAKREPRSEAQAIAAHVFLANRYRDRPVVCGFDLINEPHACTWDHDSLTGVLGFYERCGKAIQAVNPDVLVICEGITGNVNQTPAGHESDPESQQGLYTWSTWWSGKLDDARNSLVSLEVPNKVVYSPHEYGAYLEGVTLQPWFDPQAKVGSGYAGLPYPQNMAEVWRRQWGYLAEENIAPVWIGEFGSYLRIGGNPITGGGADYSALHLQKDEAWLVTLAEYCELHSISFAYWAWPPGGDPDGLLGQDVGGAWTSAQQFKVNYLSPFITTVPLEGISVAPSALSFGDRQIGSTYSLNLQLRNIGASAVSITASATGAGFSVVPNVGSVPASGALNLTVSFGALNLGAFNGKITVLHGEGQTLDIPVTAVCVDESEPGGDPIVIDLPSNAWGITAVGDSLTEGGVYFHNGWLAKACFYGNQYLRDRGNFAVSGSTVEQADTLQLPQVLAMNPPPKMCVVASGTNSIYMGLASMQKIKDICQKLIAARIYPVLWTLPPRNDTESMDGNMIAWNDAIKAYHLETGIPLLDAFEGMRVPGSMRARDDLMNPDGLHFSNYGYTVLGRHAVSTDAFKAAPTDGALALATSVGGTNLVPNPLFAGSNGVATGLQLASGFTGQLLPSAAAGNWQRIVRPAGVVGHNVANSLDVFAVPAGKTLSLACKVRWNAAGLRGGVDAVKAAWQLGMQVMFTDQNWGNFPNSLSVVIGPQGDDVEEGIFYMQLIPPTGANRLMVQMVSLSNTIEAHDKDITFDISQLTVIDGQFAFNGTDPSP